MASIEERRRKVSGSDNESGSGSGSGSGIEGASDEMISKSVEMVVLVVVVPVAVMAVRWDQSTCMHNILVQFVRTIYIIT